MKIIGCDYHPSFQQIAMVDLDTGEYVELRLLHAGGEAQRFYESLSGPVRVPSVTQEQQRLGGVQFYALLCEHVLGRRPVAVRLLYLREPLAIEARPSDQAIRGTRQRTAAVWSAIERACQHEDFRPRPSTLCNWCSFRALCPAVGGDPARMAEFAAGPGPLIRAG